MKLLKTCLITSSLTVCSVFAPLHISAESLPVLSLNAGYGSENSITDARVNIKSDGISAYSIEVRYDPRVLYFTGAEQGNALDGGSFYCNDTYSDNVVRLVWSNSRNQSCDGAAAVLHFRAASNTAETETTLSFGRSTIADDLSETLFDVNDCTMKIAGEIVKGDVNIDGYVTVADVVTLNRYLLNRNQYPMSYTAQANADISGNGSVTSADATLIMNYIAMIIKEL